MMNTHSCYSEMLSEWIENHGHIYITPQAWPRYLGHIQYTTGMVAVSRSYTVPHKRARGI